MPKSNSDTKVIASKTLEDKPKLTDTPSLENLPIEIFCLIVKDMSIAEIKIIADISTKLRDKVNSDTLWEQLINRDFGQYALCTYHKQMRAVNGISAAKLYYVFLFEGFEAKIKDFMKFLDDYGDHVKVQSWRKGQDSIQINSQFKKTKEKLGIWVASNTEARLKDVREYCNLYLEAISEFGPGENQSFQYSFPPLVYAIHNRFTLTAISLIDLPEVNVNQYTSDGVERSIILDAMLYDNDERVVNVLLERNDLNLFIKDKYGRSPLFSAHSKEVKTKVFYKMLCAAGADGIFKILPFILESNIRKKDVFQYMCTLVQNSAAIQENLKILYFSIAESEGKYCSALSYYFHEIKSPHDVVKKVKSLIEIQERNLITNIQVDIKYPELVNNNLDYWAVEDPSNSVWCISRETLVRTLESIERRIEDIDDLAVIDVNDEDHRYSIALVNAMFDYSAKQSLNRLMLQTLGFAVLGIGVGLAFGLGLGLGAHVHIAATVLSSVISAALTCVLSVRYNYHRFMGPEPTSTSSSTATYRPSVVASSTTPGNTLNSSHVNESRINSVC